MRAVTKELVLLYLSGQIPSLEQRRQIDQARQTDPEVARWFELLQPPAEPEEEDTVDVGTEAESDDDLPPSEEVRAALRSLLAKGHAARPGVAAERRSPDHFPIPEHFHSHLAPAETPLTMGADSSSGRFEEFHSGDGKTVASLRERGRVPHLELILSARAAPDRVGDKLQRFEILDGAMNRLFHGFIGLQELDDGSGYGEVVLGWRGAAGTPRPAPPAERAGLYLRCGMCALQELKAEDLEALERSLANTEAEVSQQVLRDALQGLRAGLASITPAAQHAPALAREVHFAVAAGHVGRQVLASFHDEKNAVEAFFEQQASGILNLRVTVATGWQRDRLARFTIRSLDRKAELARGFVGLCEASPGGKWAGEISLDAFDVSPGKRIERERGCYVQVDVCSFAELKPEDRERLELSRDCNAGLPAAEKALDEALKRIGADSQQP